MKKKAVQKQAGSEKGRFAVVAALALACAAATLLIQFYFVAKTMCKTDLSPQTLGLITTVNAGLSSFAAGLTLGRQTGRSGMLLGFLGGGMICLLLMLAAWAGQKAEFGQMAMIKLVVLSAAGALGGALGERLARRRRRRH